MDALYSITPIMPQNDYFKLPCEMRRVVDNRLYVLASTGKGQQNFVPVTLV